MVFFTKLGGEIRCTDYRGLMYKWRAFYRVGADMLVKKWVVDSLTRSQYKRLHSLLRARLVVKSFA